MSTDSNITFSMGSALKKPAENNENEEPRPKRRLTKESNPDFFYSIRILKGTQIPKFQTKSINYRITFKELEVKSLPEILRTLKILFQSIIDNIIHFIDKTDLVTHYNICDRNDVYIYFDFECTQDDVYQCDSGYFPDENGKCRNCRKHLCGSCAQTQLMRRSKVLFVVY